MSDLKERIVSLVGSHEEGLKATVAAKVLNENLNTIKSMMSRLSKESILVKDYCGVKGFYGLSPLLQKKRYGGNRYPLRFQNVWIYAEIPIELPHDKYVTFLPDKDSGPWKVQVEVGATTKKISVNLSGAEGFDFLGLCLVISDTIAEINSKYKLSLTDKDYFVSANETFTDYFRVGLAGVKSVSFYDWKTSILKIYDKSGRVRVEAKNFCNLPVGVFLENFRHPGIISYVEAVAETNEKISKIEASIYTLSKDLHYLWRNVEQKLVELNPKVKNVKESDFDDFRRASELK